MSKGHRRTLNQMVKKLHVVCCMLHCVNLKPSDVIPQLYIDNKPLPVKDFAVYLEDNNSKGTNTDLVEARVQKGKGCSQFHGSLQ